MLRIRDWAKHYEKAGNRACRVWNWVALPNKLDGEGYHHLVTGHPNGPAHYAVWISLIIIASKCDPRGSLAKDGGKPMTLNAIAIRSKLPESLLQEAIPRLCSEEIGWLEEVPDNLHCNVIATPFQRAAMPLQLQTDRQTDKTLQTGQTPRAGADAVDVSIYAERIHAAVASLRPDRADTIDLIGAALIDRYGTAMEARPKLERAASYFERGVLSEEWKRKNRQFCPSAVKAIRSGRCEGEPPADNSDAVPDWMEGFEYEPPKARRA